MPKARSGRKPPKAAACTGKIQYETREEAEEAAELSKRYGGVFDLKTYPCPYCGAFHNGHPPRK